MPLAAHDAADRVEQLITLTERLTACVKADVEALRARRPEEARLHRDENAALARVYREETARIKTDPALVAGAPIARRQALAEATKAFHDALDAYGELTAAMQEISEGLVASVARFVAQTRSQGAGYGPGAATSTNQAARAITYDTRT